MSEDSLLKALGKLAREQAAEPPPAELMTPPHPTVKETIAARAVSAFGKPAPERLERRARTSWWVALLAPVALAAAGVALFTRGGGALPAYALEARGGHAELRGTTDRQPLVLGPGAPLELVLRPATEADGKVEARVFLVSGGAHLVWTPDERTASPQGGLRLRGVLSATPGAGPGEIVVIVGRPGSLPLTPEDVDRGAGTTVTQPVSWR